MESVWLLIYMFAIPLLTATAVAAVMRRILLRELAKIVTERDVGVDESSERTGYHVEIAEQDVLCDVVVGESGGNCYSGTAAETAFTEIKKAYSLTDREMEILMELFAGNGNRVIASKLFISENTVKTHIHNLLQKMESPSRVEAVDKVRAAMAEPVGCVGAV